MENTRSHLCKSFLGLVHSFVWISFQVIRWFDEQVSMSNMGRVVNWKPNSNHNVDQDKVVEVQSPEIDQSNQVKIHKENTESD